MENEKMSLTLTGEAAQVVLRHSEGPRKRGEFVSAALVEWQAIQDRGAGDSKDLYAILQDLGRKIDKLIERG